MPIDPTTLEPGERLLWSGRPNALRYAQARGGINLIIGFAVLVFAQVWTARASGDGSQFAWVGAIFFLIALALLLSPLWRMWRGLRTVYGLTDRRALTVVGGPFPRRISVPLHQIHSVELRQRPGNLGDVLFREIVRQGADTNVAGREGFITIAGADAVERLLLSSINAKS
jgi:hypothetical protein